MKKIFSVFVLIMAFVLASCNMNGASQKSAGLDFKISVVDLARLRNSVSREADDDQADYNDPDYNSPDEIMKFIVQLAGEDGYYQSQIRTINFTEIEKELEKKYAALEEKAGELEQKYGQMEEEFAALYAKYGINDPENITESQGMALYSNPEFLAEYQALLQKYGMNSAASYLDPGQGHSNPEKTTDDLLDDVYDDMGLGDFKDMFSANPYAYLDSYLSFSFPDLVPGNYTIMADMFNGELMDAKEQIEWSMTGQKSIRVFAGRNQNIELQLSSVYDSYNGFTKPQYFDLEFSYEKSGSLITQTTSLTDFIDGYKYNPETEEYDWVDARYQLGLVRDKVCFVDTTISDDVWHAFKSFDLILKEDSHFAREFSITGKIEEELYAFEDGRLSLLDKLDIYNSDMDIMVEQAKDGGSISFRMSEENLPACPEIDEDDWGEKKPDQDPENNQGQQEGGENQQQEGENQQEEGGNQQQGTGITIIQEEKSGTIEIEESALTFTKRGDPPKDDFHRFVKGIDLSEILEGKTLSNGDTIVFTLKPDQDENILASLKIDQFYYQLQPADWQDIADSELYEGNNCITLSDASIIVMPLNFVEDAKDYKTLLLFFDSASSQEELELKCSISYHIFPSDTKTYVFGVGKNYDPDTKDLYPYRYVMDLSLNDTDDTMLDLEEGQTVSVVIEGTVKNYYGEAFEEYNSAYNFTGEVYDGAMYTSSLGPDNTYFHPMSKTEASGNIKSLMVYDGQFEGNGLFCFADIQKPFFDAKTDDLDLAHKYFFQLQTPCYSSEDIGSDQTCDPEVLLVIQGFDITITAD